jgi:hypothetical protein
MIRRDVSINLLERSSSSIEAIRNALELVDKIWTFSGTKYVPGTSPNLPTVTPKDLLAALLFTRSYSYELDSFAGFASSKKAERCRRLQE